MPERSGLALRKPEKEGLRWVTGKLSACIAGSKQMGGADCFLWFRAGKLRGKHVLFWQM